eukprot:TRINITY_DN1159_c0_g1_i1.p1 TRINITY_DN1159_c0_g1~~TRINITY_DN1159_c0_g1_i1.p1  ORF type:complete len:135 (-),score=32.12 TRINITY_DN1159_c0_g1_i1:86-490(-)
MSKRASKKRERSSSSSTSIPYQPPPPTIVNYTEPLKAKLARVREHTELIFTRINQQLQVPYTKEEINRDREILKVLINEFEQTIAESKIGGLTYQPMARLESLDQKVKTDLNNVDQKNKLLLSMATSVQRRFEG